MNKYTIDEPLVDEIVDAYVVWREERTAVWDAYARWACALDQSSFRAYHSALDREERASWTYALVLSRALPVRRRWSFRARARKLRAFGARSRP